MDFTHFASKINSHPHLKKLDDNNKNELARDLVYQQIEERLNLFEACLDSISK
jgi:hypothetical protein